MLKKVVYPYQYMDAWRNFTAAYQWKASQMLTITDADYKHAKIFWKDFRLQNLGQYHDLYVQSDTLLLVDIFEGFRNKCLKIYELDPAHFFLAPGLVWQAYLKKTKIKQELLTDADILLIIGKDIRDKICHVVHRNAKANNKLMKDYGPSIESYLMCWDVNNQRTSMGNITKDAWRWFQVDKEKFNIYSKIHTKLQ